MAAFVDAGITTFDCADIYTGVEEMIGRFRARMLAARGAEALTRLKVHTKFVPDWDALRRVDAPMCAAIIDRSLRAASAWSASISCSSTGGTTPCRAPSRPRSCSRSCSDEGKIDRIGGTNFDTAHTRALLDAGVPLVSMQVQYSLLDARPENGLAALCEERGMKLLCYGTVAGGFLSERWLGAPEPRGAAGQPLPRQVQADHRRFRRLGLSSRACCDPEGSRRASTASASRRWRPGGCSTGPRVAGAIIGARYAEHLPDNLNVFRFALDDDDRAAIDARPRPPDGPRGRYLSPSSATATAGTDASCTTTSTRPEPWPTPIIPSPGRPCGRWSTCTPSSRRGSAGRAPNTRCGIRSARRRPAPKASPW